MSYTIRSYTIEHCKLCSKSHTFKIKVEKKQPLFGGPGDNSGLNTDNEFMFNCPEKKLLFSSVVKPEPGEIVVGVALEEETLSDLHEEANKDLLKDDYNTWFKESYNRSQSYCSTMLGTSTGAIGLYFALQKYLGAEKIQESANATLGIIPPVFYFIASLCFVIALKPQFKTVAPSEFEKFKLERFKTINVFMQSGFLFFTLATLFTLFHFY